MTYADSILRIVDRQQQVLRALEGPLRAAESHHGSGEWDAREVLLHLIGATHEMPEDLRRAAAVVAPRQPGGQYFDKPELTNAVAACAVLISQLDAIAHAVRDLDDRALRRRVTATDSDGHPLPDVPIGLVVRHGLTEHFDDHIEQLREALGVGEVQ